MDSIKEKAESHIPTPNVHEGPQRAMITLINVAFLCTVASITFVVQVFFLAIWIAL